MGFERLDEKSGDLEIDPKRIFFVVYDIGCTEYHLQLLDNCFYSKGRSRNETNLVVDTSLKVSGRVWQTLPTPLVYNLAGNTFVPPCKKLLYTVCGSSVAGFLRRRQARNQEAVFSTPSRICQSLGRVWIRFRYGGHAWPCHLLWERPVEIEKTSGRSRHRNKYSCNLCQKG